MKKLITVLMMAVWVGSVVCAQQGTGTTVERPVFSETQKKWFSERRYSEAAALYDVSGNWTLTGNLGVGTALPNETVQVVGDTGATRLWVEEASSTPQARSMLWLKNNGGIRFAMQTGPGNIWQFNALAEFNIDYNGHPGNEFQVQPDGDVVIGGDLYVNGGIPVPDYVFEEDYDLMELEELGQYISENKHLPSIPSAEEVEKSGINMTELQLKLLEKIEELTLYTLQQEEMIRRQEESFQAQVDTLTARLEELENR